MTKAERIEFIGLKLAIGETLQQVADSLGITRQRVHAIAKDHGFRRVPKEKVIKVKNPRRGPCVKFAEVRDECKSKGLPDPYRKWLQHRKTAKDRGIEFFLTFPEWWSIWEADFPERGTRKGCKVMCRYLDSGPYEVGNVRIDTIKGNAAERGLVVKISRPMWKSRRNDSKSAGWIDCYTPRPKTPYDEMKTRQEEQDTN